MWTPGLQFHYAPSIKIPRPPQTTNPKVLLILLLFRYGIWLHVDAAWAGSAAICPEQRHWFRGLDQVDSYSFNPHKWLMTVADCCTMWVADTAAVRAALTLAPAYLRGEGNEWDMKDMQLPLSRRFRWVGHRSLYDC
jgi:glutamate/tyrosine decarboxylase-like PLP-dependent enzyme